MGDALNSYNDGPAEPGADPLGPFYELETSSPALSLAPGQSAEHVQDTYHLTGDAAALNRVSATVLHADLQQIRESLPSNGGDRPDQVK